MERLLETGWRVIAITAADEYAGKLSALGVETEVVRFDRGGFHPVNDWSAYRQLVRLYRQYRPTLVHHFHAKPVILGTRAARAALGARVRVVNTITGLGHAFIHGGFVRQLASLGYRQALPAGDITIFQNRDDRDLFLEQGWVRRDGTRLIVSSGVDTRRFRPDGREPEPRVLMVGRLIRQKGILEFIEAARRLKTSHPEMRFQLAGEPDPRHPDAVPQAEIERAVGSGWIEYLGFVDDLPARLPRCYAFVLPSYREGVPRAVLEAGACGVPTVGADVPGTREVVADGVTGLLVPVRDADALFLALERLIGDRGLRDRLGQAAEASVRRDFDLRAIVQQQLDTYAELGMAVGAAAA